MRTYYLGDIYSLDIIIGLYKLQKHEQTKSFLSVLAIITIRYLHDH